MLEVANILDVDPTVLGDHCRRSGCLNRVSMEFMEGADRVRRANAIMTMLLIYGRYGSVDLNEVDYLERGKLKAEECARRSVRFGTMESAGRRRANADGWLSNRDGVAPRINHREHGLIGDRWGMV